MEELDLGKVIELINKQGLEATLKQLGITEEQLREEGGYPIEQLLDGQEGVNSSMNEDFVPDYTKTAEYEGDGITSELIPGESALTDSIIWLAEKAGVPPEAALVMAGIVGKNPKNIKKGTEGMFTPRKNKGNQLTDKRGTKSGELIGDSKKGGPGVAVGKPGPASQVPSKHVKYPVATRKIDETRKFGLTDKNKWRAGAGIATGVAIDQVYRGLKGNRNPQGDFTVFDEDRLDPPTGPDMPEEASENQFGYHKKEGQNFWTVDNDDPYWDTHDIEGSSAFEETPLKQQPQQELDWDFWFK